MPEVVREQDGEISAMRTRCNGNVLVRRCQPIHRPQAHSRDREQLRSMYAQSRPLTQYLHTDTMILPAFGHAPSTNIVSSATLSSRRSHATGPLRGPIPHMQRLPDGPARTGGIRRAEKVRPVGVMWGSAYQHVSKDEWIRGCLTRQR